MFRHPGGCLFIHHAPHQYCQFCWLAFTQTQPRKSLIHCNHRTDEKARGSNGRKTAVAVKTCLPSGENLVLYPTPSFPQNAQPEWMGASPQPKPNSVGRVPRPTAGGPKETTPEWLTGRYIILLMICPSLSLLSRPHTATRRVAACTAPMSAPEYLGGAEKVDLNAPRQTPGARKSAGWVRSFFLTRFSSRCFHTDKSCTIGETGNRSF